VPGEAEFENRGGEEEYGSEEAECNVGFEHLAGRLTGQTAPIPDTPAVQRADILLSLAFGQI
jgi:hypothetical protein